MLLFFASLALTIALILGLERFAHPRSNRPIFHRLSMLSTMPPVVFYSTLFMVSYRPVFSALVTLVVFAGIVIVNNAKMAILREPLVFSDFALLRQAIQYPALYIKYVGVGKVVGVIVAAVSAVVLAVTLESPLVHRSDLDDFFPMALYLVTVIGLIYSITRGPFRGPFSDLLRRFGPTASVAQDMDKLSLVVCLIFYFFLSNEPALRQAPPVRPRPRRPARVPSPLPPGLKRTHVVAVQSESFFDARRLHPSIPQNLLARYDAAAREASYRGRLTVPAWGANTMRTEFAFLSGLPNEALGFHRFNPYLSLCKKPVWTIAHLFRSMGYRTICVHPFHASFFDRETVFPNLGFDRFIDIESFGDAAHFGPYVCDVAVADKICEVLDEDSEKPAFVFAITMENHGKWEKGRLDDCPADDAIEERPLGSHELGSYLRHLRNTDGLVDRIVSDL
ncbi:MAG TPA: LTA synthase family protein, partial [Magnetospirillum sp.]|nr:LTA synthase family protein [Magnetospirillum sp.]